MPRVQSKRGAVQLSSPCLTLDDPPYALPVRRKG
jgi:hypothetical protein